MRKVKWVLIAVASVLMTGGAAASPSKHVTLILAATAAWEGDAVYEPSVIRDHGVFKMWYSGGERCGVGYATSRDGIHWGKYNENPVLGQGVGGIKMACRNSVVKHRGVYYLFFSTGTGGPTSGDSIRVATSKDGKRWKVASGPVLLPGRWDLALANTTVWVEHGRWMMLYDAQGPDWLWRTGVAEGSTPFKFTKIAGPLDRLSLGGTYGAPDVVRTRFGYRLVYLAAETHDNLPTDIFESFSTDLRAWSVPRMILQRSDATFAYDQVGDPDTVTVNGHRWLFFDGDDNRGHFHGAIGVVVPSLR